MMNIRIGNLLLTNILVLQVLVLCLESVHPWVTGVMLKLNQEDNTCLLPVNAPRNNLKFTFVPAIDIGNLGGGGVGL